MLLTCIIFCADDDDNIKLIDWDEGLNDRPKGADNGSEAGSDEADGQRGLTCAAGGAERHEAAEEGGGAAQVGSDLHVQ